jgi:tetratricopeptide (TPR) repeat protein
MHKVGLCYGFLLGVVLGGCSASVLVPRRDVTFQRAQARLNKTEALLREVDTTPAERLMFLQAESFYRYRFDPPPRHVFNYMTQVAAAVTDFPALQAVSGSLDLAELRLRSYDAAIHIWETLLEQYPQTQLRPLALYRLGWAYRSGSALGFPHESGDEAFNDLIEEYPKSPLVPITREALKVSWKSKKAATGWSIVPGLGQMYVGRYGSGAIRLAVALVAAAMVIVPSVIAIQRGADLTWSHDWPLLATSLGGLIILSIDYTTAYQDALQGVVLWNERCEAAFDAAHPDAP